MRITGLINTPTVKITYKINERKIKFTAESYKPWNFPFLLDIQNQSDAYNWLRCEIRFLIISLCEPISESHAFQLDSLWQPKLQQLKNVIVLKTSGYCN